MLSGSKTFGIFIDFPSKIRWDIGYTTTNKTVITIDGTDFDIYYIDGIVIAPTALLIAECPERRNIACAD